MKHTGNIEPRPDPWAEPKLSEAEVKARFLRRFIDPIYDPHRETLTKLADLAWQAAAEHHKAPFTREAGPGFADPTYKLSDEWRATKQAIDSAQKVFADANSPSQILIVSASNRNDRSCPGEVSKSRRLVKLAEDEIQKFGFQTEVLDLSLVTSEYGKTIHPCKGCVSTAMPLCHWPCSCYPNHAIEQSHDWMNEIYPKWVRAHGILIVTPVYWSQAPSALKLMMERLVCADGGNPDPTTTQGKKAKLAKKIEMDGWSYPRHLSGRVYSAFVHGDASGIDALSAALDDWLSSMNLIPASRTPVIARYIDYYGPYATSHLALDEDHAVQEELRNSARALVATVLAARAGDLVSMNPSLPEPRPK